MGSWLICGTLMNIWTVWLLARSGVMAQISILLTFLFWFKIYRSCNECCFRRKGMFTREEQDSFKRALVLQFQRISLTARVILVTSMILGLKQVCIRYNVTVWLIDALRVELGFKNLNRVASASVLSPWRRQELRLILHGGVWFAVHDGSNSFSSQIW